MKRNILFILASISLLTFTFSCKKSPLTNGKVITETRELLAFNTLYLYDNVDVTLISSDTYKVEITTGENLMPNIICESDGKELVLRNDNVCNWLRSYDVPLEAKIYYKSDISSIFYESVGDLHSETYLCNDTTSRFDLNIKDGAGDIDLKVNCKNLYLDVNDGTNKITMQGKSDYTYISQQGLGPIETFNFPSNKIDVYSFGSNNIYINCIQKLNANIYDIGCIYYKGQPEIKSYISPYAKGKLKQFE